MLCAWRSASSCRRPGEKRSLMTSSPLHFYLSSKGSICGYAWVYTLFHQQISLYSVEPLTLPPSFFQLLLAVGQPSLLLPHCPLVVAVNVLQLLIGALEDLSRQQPSFSALVAHSLRQAEIPMSLRRRQNKQTFQVFHKAGEFTSSKIQTQKRLGIAGVWGLKKKGWGGLLGSNNIRLNIFTSEKTQGQTCLNEQQSNLIKNTHPTLFYYLLHSFLQLLVVLLHLFLSAF